MLDVFKKPVRIECDSLEEVANVLTWLRKNDYVSNLNRTDYQIGIRANGPLNKRFEVMSFYVDIPYDIAKKSLRPFTVEQSFQEIRKGS